MRTADPVLWHLKASSYSEKARWALDYKRVLHVRRAATPGRHRTIAEGLTGGRTLPVLVIDGQAIGDSARIIDVLERRYPDLPLYPADPDERRQALEIEDFFDKHLGRHTCLLLVHYMLLDADLTLGAFFPDLVGLRRRAVRKAFSVRRRRLAAAFEIDDRSVARAFGKLFAAGERFRAELQPGGYLVADRFTVADLTVAALLAPAVAPKQFPYPQPQRGHPLLAPLRDALAGSGLLDWTREMYARRRGLSAESAP